MDVLAPTINNESSLKLSVLIDRGRFIFHKATAHARKMLQDQGALPIVDAVKIDTDNNVIDTFSQPLLPIVPHEESGHFCFDGSTGSLGAGTTSDWGERGG